MSHRRTVLGCFVTALVTQCVIVFACAPAFGPPFDKAMFESIFRMLPVAVLLLPLTAGALVVIIRIIPLRPPFIFTMWLTACAAVGVIPWLMTDAIGDFRQHISHADLPSLKVLNREQWTSFSDSSTWLFAFQLNDPDQRKLIDALELTPAEPMSPDPTEPIDARESWLRRWPAYHPPANARYWSGPLTTLVEDCVDSKLYICRQADPRSR